MVVAIAIWSLDLSPGKEEVFIPQGDVRISNAALGEKLADQNGRTLVKLTFSKLAEADTDDEEDQGPESNLILCSLTAGKIENAQVNLVLEEGAEYKFQLVGKNPVSLSGNYVDQISPDQPPFGDDDFDSEDEEDAYDLREVSSDVEMDPHELDDVESDASRFEEADEPEAPKPTKRARESETLEQEKSSQPDKKSKKMKKANGDAVPVGKAEKEAEAQTTGEKKQEKGKKQEKEKTQDKAGGDKEFKTLDSGIKIRDPVVGTGPQAKKGDKLSMRYIGKLQNGKVFDKNTKGKPFVFRLGAGEVIKGWDEGLVGMQVGSERVLTIPPQLAYGKRGSKPDIPPNATLTFEVKLVGIN